MKIAFILPGIESSGGVRCVSLVAKRLRDRGHARPVAVPETEENAQGLGKGNSKTALPPLGA